MGNNPKTTTVSGKTYYPDSEGYLHTTPQGAIEANLQIESTTGQHVTGGNCGQDPQKVSSGNGSDSNEGNSNSGGKK